MNSLEQLMRRANAALEKIRKSNTCHVPSGPSGGQFCTGGSGGGGGVGGGASVPSSGHKYPAGSSIAGSSYDGATFKVTPAAAETIHVLQGLQPRSPAWGVHAKQTGPTVVTFHRKEPGSAGSSRAYHQVGVHSDGSWTAQRVSGKGSGTGRFGVYWKTQELGQGTGAVSLSTFKF